MIVGKHLRLQAQERPEKVAIICNDQRFTFFELNRMANWLLAKGLKKGDRAGLLLPNCAEFAVTYFALMKMGALAVILDFRLSPSEMPPLFDETEAKALITHSAFKTFAAKMVREKGETLRHVVVVGEKGTQEEGLCPYDRLMDWQQFPLISLLSLSFNILKK